MSGFPGGREQALRPPHSPECSPPMPRVSIPRRPLPSSGRALLATALVALCYAGGQSPRTISGLILASSDADTLSLRDDAGHLWSVTPAEDLTVLDDNGRALGFNELHPGFTIVAHGRRANERAIRASSVQVLSSPEITVVEPAEGDTIRGPELRVRGWCRAFESTINYRIHAGADTSAPVLAYHYAMCASPEVGRFGPYEIVFPLNDVTTDALTIAVFEESPRDGEGEINGVVVHVVVAREE